MAMNLKQNQTTECHMESFTQNYIFVNEDDLIKEANKLGLDITLIFCRFDFYRFGLVKLVKWI